MRVASLFVALVAIAALAAGVASCRRAPEASDVTSGSGRACAAAVLADDDVAGPVCRACRARGEVAP